MYKYKPPKSLKRRSKTIYVKLRLSRQQSLGRIFNQAASGCAGEAGAASRRRRGSAPRAARAPPATVASRRDAECDHARLPARQRDDRSPRRENARALN